MKIVQLDQSVDLWLTYSWGNYNQGVCGHMFECIEYYYIFKKHFKTKILICEDMNIKTIQKAIESKYNFNNEELSDILDAFIFHDRPTVVKGKNIFLTDGNFSTMEGKFLYFDNVFMFACSDLTYMDKDVIVFQDQRIHPKHKNGHNYVKKILFDKLKTIESSLHGNMMYITKGVRELSIEDLESLSDNYQKIKLFTNVEKYRSLSDKFEYYQVPVDNPFEQFDTYIYTPIDRKKDCSPRFLAECVYYGKSIIYSGIDYWNEDLGLKYRVEDINENFSSLFLKEDDEIIGLIYDTISNTSE